MVTINLDALRGGGTMPRASVNGLQWTEALPLRGGGVLLDTPIKSSRNVHSVLAWTPANNAIDQEIGNPVTVNFKAENADLENLDFTDTESFDGDGTHNGTVSSGTAIELATTSPFIDFENYTLWGNIIAAGQPHSWTKLDQKNDGDVMIATDPDGLGEQSVRFIQGSTRLLRRYDEVASYAGEVKCRIMWPADGNISASIFFQTTGAGTGMRGYVISLNKDSIYALFSRVNDWDSWYGIRSDNHGTNFLDDTWYWFAVKFSGTSSTSSWYKVWKDGDTEPEAWRWGGSDSVYTREGYVGVGYVYPSGWWTTWMDDFQFQPDPPLYGTSGNWESDPLDVSAANVAAGHRINFDITTPTDTTAVVKCRWGLGDTWLTCTDGAKLPGLLYREDMRTGAARSLLYLRIELATTDTLATPEVDNLTVDFDPCLFEDIELTVDGKLATIANGHLGKWGREQISGGALIEAFDDLYVQAHSFQSYRLQGEAIAVVFEYDGFEVGNISFSQLLQAFYANPGPRGYFAFRGGSFEALATANYTIWTKWYRGFHDYQWTLIDKTQGIHADAWFWIGHAQADDFIGSIIGAIPELSDHPGSMLAEAYKRDDFPGCELIQGYRFDETIGSVLPGVEEMNDFLGLTVVAIGHRTDAPGSLVVFGVNRKNEIDIQTIDADTVAELEKLGFVFPAEAP